MSVADPAFPATGNGSGSDTARPSSLAPPFEPVASVSSSSSTVHGDQDTIAAASGGAENKKKQKRRSIFGFGKKKPADDAAGPIAPSASSGDAAATIAIVAPTPIPTATTTTPTLSLSKPTPTRPSAASQARDDAVTRKPTSPVQADSASVMSASITSSGIGGGLAGGGSGYGSYYVVPPASPGRSFTALSSSPRLSSPAGSQIFERDVQQSGSVVMVPNSPAIPSHFTTENYIPSVLDASSEAITDDHLDPDTVEIITHANHQLAMLTVAGIGGAGSSAASVGTPAVGGGGTGAWVDDVASSFGGPLDKDDGASNYGSFDPTDVRRLSFISFADVVQAEHQQQQQQLQQMASSGSLAGLASLAAAATAGAAASPPVSKSGSVKGHEFSPVRKPLASPTKSPSLAPSLAPLGVNVGVGSGGELAVETMAQALRRTGSGDLGGFRSPPQSPI